MPLRIQLRTATEDDIPRIDDWARASNAGRFMSRHLPDRLQAVLWKIVIVNGMEAGTVWVERKPGKPNVGFLGILIGQSELHGKGIGCAVIEEAVANVRAIAGDVLIQLNVRSSNTRAIACYKKCGFVGIASAEKMDSDGVLIPTITMQFSPHLGSTGAHSANAHTG